MRTPETDTKKPALRGRKAGDSVIVGIYTPKVREPASYLGSVRNPRDINPSA